MGSDECSDYYSIFFYWKIVSLSNRDRPKACITARKERFDDKKAYTGFAENEGKI